MECGVRGRNEIRARGARLGDAWRKTSLDLWLAALFSNIKSASLFFDSIRFDSIRHHCATYPPLQLIQLVRTYFGLTLQSPIQHVELFLTNESSDMKNSTLPTVQREKSKQYSKSQVN